MSPAPVGGPMTMAVQKASPEYSIIWKAMADARIAARAVYGKSVFTHLSSQCKFKPGQGWVGNLYGNRSGNVTVLWDTLVVDPRQFLRKHAALVNGITSIVFLHDEEGSLQEFGFKSCVETESFLSWLNAAAKRSNESMISESSLIGKLPSGSNDSGDSDSDSVKSLPSVVGFISTKRAWTDDHLDLFRRPSGDWAVARDMDSLSVCTVPLSNTCTWPSIGSKGHPHNCGQVCKYAWKSSGCKDGKNCTRCHICRYTRGTISKQQKKHQKLEHLVQD